MIGRVVIKCDRKVFLVKEQEILFVEAAGNYACVGVGSATLLTRTSLNRMEKILDTTRFMRIHRSVIVNLDQVGHIEPQPGGEYLMTLRCGKQFKASRSHVSELIRSLRGYAGEEATAPNRGPGEVHPMGLTMAAAL